MKKGLTTLLAFVFGCAIAFSQESKITDNLTVGAELGFSIPTMKYSSQMYDSYKRSPRFAGTGGVFVDWSINNNWSIRPHLNFVGRGVKMEYSPLYIDYKLKATYFDIRIPVVYSFDINSKFRPYVAAGPSLNFATGGKVHYSEGHKNNQAYDIKLSKGSFRGADFGLYFGAGVDYPITIYGYPFKIGAKLGYNLGFVDTFSKREKNNESTALNTPIYYVDGTRKNRNLSFSVNISIPLKALLGGNKRSRRAQIQKPVAQPIEKMPERKVTVREKECCSLEEMYELILNGQDISRKKVCAFNDIRFDFDKTTIRPESEEYLDMFVTILTKFPTINLSIIGHTDSVGDDSYNMVLSKKRAEAVADYFIKHGIDPSRLNCYGYGARQPLTDNASSEARAMNRRVEFDIIGGAF